MAELGKTVRVLFQDGQERTFTNVLVDQETAGWLLSPACKKAQLSRGGSPIAGYRLQTLKGWEYVEAAQQTDTSMNGQSKENGGDGKRTL